MKLAHAKPLKVARKLVVICGACVRALAFRPNAAQDPRPAGARSAGGEPGTASRARAKFITSTAIDRRVATVYWCRMRVSKKGTGPSRARGGKRSMQRDFFLGRLTEAPHCLQAGCFIRLAGAVAWLFAFPSFFIT